jgi:acetyl esterase/lipase
MRTGPLALVALLATNPAGLAQAPKLPPGMEALTNLSYGPHDRNKLDLVVPKAAKPVPVVLWVHGGGWEAGDKSNAMMRPALLAKGYAVASTNYRYSKQAVFPAQIADVRAAVRFLKANAKKYGIDPDRIGVMGASAGGHLVALLGVAPTVSELDGEYKSSDVTPDVKCVCDIFGPADLTTIVPGDNAANPVASLLGGPSGKKKDLATLASPLAHVTKQAPPFLILHGDKDPLVPLNQSERFAKKLKEAGAECELVVLKGAGHGGPQFAAEAPKVLAFFDKHLKGN